MALPIPNATVVLKTQMAMVSSTSITLALMLVQMVNTLITLTDPARGVQLIVLLALHQLFALHVSMDLIS